MSEREREREKEVMKCGEEASSSEGMNEKSVLIRVMKEKIQKKMPSQKKGEKKTGDQIWWQTDAVQVSLLHCFKD